LIDRILIETLSFCCFFSKNFFIKMNYQFSIIIPCYNDKDLAVELINFLTTFCTKDKVEILLCIPEECIKEYNDCAFAIVTSKDISRASQMNAGAIVAKFETLIFLHADVIPPKDFIHSIESALQEGCQAGFFSYRFSKSSCVMKVNELFTKIDGIFAGGGDQCLLTTH
jgi:glycosyltransferase involved in cell wall biosynthesis